MSRYIVFEGAPSTVTCLNALDNAQAWEAEAAKRPLWSMQHTSSLDLQDEYAPERDEQTTSVQAYNVDVDRGSQFGPTGLYDGELNWADDDEFDDEVDNTREFKRYKVSLGATDDTSMDEDTRMHGFHAPPTQDATRLSQLWSQAKSQPSSRSERPANETTLFSHYPDETFDSMASIGPPPRYAWDPSELTPFDHFRSILRLHKDRRKPSVSFLAAIVDVKSARHVGAGSKQVGEWTLMDPSSLIVKFNIWGSGADDLTSVVRRGDIIFVDNAKLSEYQGKLQLSVNHEHGRPLTGWGLQIAWRTEVRSSDDLSHRFDERLRGQNLAKVDAVLSVVDWWTKWKGGG